MLGMALLRYVVEKFGMFGVYRSATEMVGGISGESEKNVREMFKSVGDCGGVLFIDELDAIAGKKDNASKDMEKRTVL
jgi:ribosome biogenesis ATPase